MAVFVPIIRAAFKTVILVAVLAGSAYTSEPANQADLQLAADIPLPRIPGLSGPAADWRQFDSFFTFVVKRFAQDVPANLRDSLGDAFLDSRYELTSVLGLRGGQNPVPELFLSGWRRLSPIMNQALPGMPKQTATQYANFISAADKLAALGQKGSQLGLLQLSPDALRGLARLIEPRGAVDPIAYSTNVDSQLRTLLGFGSLPVPRPAPGVRQSRSYRFFLFPDVYEASVPSFAEGALAAEPDKGKLAEWLPDGKELQPYLLRVRDLLAGVSDKIRGKSQLAVEHQRLYRQTIFAAAWQESCWRQFIRKGKEITPLASATGDLGLMQVNRHTWRGVYDLKGLGGDIEYNGNAGGEILLYYLTRHAIKKNEEKQQGGNLARATYAAYNGGPGHLGRYRAVKQNPALKKVDESFWEKFQAVSAGRELDVQRCYEKN